MRSSDAREQAIAFVIASASKRLVIKVVMGSIPDPAWAWDQILGKDPSLIQTLAQIFERGLENWSFYSVIIRDSSRLGSELY